MTCEELNTKLYEKMFDEQRLYRDWLLTLPPEEILHHAYEYTVREDIVFMLEYRDLNENQAKALLGLAAPVADIYKDFEKRESSHMEELLDTIECRANKIILNKNRERNEAR